MKLLINLESKLCVLIVFICAISLTACGGGSSSSGGGSSPYTYTSGTLPNSESISIKSIESIIYSFGVSPNDGANPYASLIRDESGNLYGTTASGGSNNKGTVFKISPAGQESVIHRFGGFPNDGAVPYASLIRDESGNLYGTTLYGESNNKGTVFKISPAGQKSVIYSFGVSPNDGARPFAGLIRDESGNLYGTTYFGGNQDNNGTVFKISRDGQESVIHRFVGFPNDGAVPYASLIRDESGNLYGTTESGGSNNKGTVFKISPAGKETIIHSFGDGDDGANPYASLIRDESGNLYGTTAGGGTQDDKGTVFKISRDGQESVIHRFGVSPNDGSFPIAGLIRDESGNLYGTTYYGGIDNNGTVFKISRDGQESVIHRFGGKPDGLYPFASLIRDESGNLYGTTVNGGRNGLGTVFKIYIGH